MTVVVRIGIRAVNDGKPFTSAGVHLVEEGFKLAIGFHVVEPRENEQQHSD